MKPYNKEVYYFLDKKNPMEKSMNNKKVYRCMADIICNDSKRQSTSFG